MKEKYWHSKFKEIFGLDLRGLACLRVCYGLLLLADLSNRLHDLSAHYSDSGVLPRSLIFAQHNQPGISLYFMGGTDYFVLSMFLLSALCAVSLTLGYKTRWVSVISWVLLISLQRRDPLVLCAEDTYIKLIMFWGMFLPWGERYSLDSLLKGPRSIPTQAFSLPVFSFLTQMFLIYICSGYLKSGDEWVKDGSAISYALNYGQITRPAASLLLQHLGFLRIMTFSTVYLERFGPLLWFFPIWTSYLRMISVSFFLLFHWGMWLSLDIDLFPLMCMASLMALMPKEFWDIFKGARLVSDNTMAKIREKLHFLSTPSTGQALPEKRITHRLRTVSVNIFLAMALGYVICENISTLPHSKLRVPHALNWFSDVFWLNQKWTVFAPNVGKDDGWFIVAGTLVNGSQVDLFQNGKPLTLERPDFLTVSVKNTHWRQYMMSLVNKHLAYYRPRYGSYVCSQWNRQHNDGEKLKNLEFIYMMEYSLPLGKKAPPKKQEIFKYKCF